jgi:hypothetical protein
MIFRTDTWMESDPECLSCPNAWYFLSGCTCEYIPGWGFTSTCVYTFYGCSDSPDFPPIPPDPTEREAFILAFTYGFNPPRASGPARLRGQNLGKYEPDHNPYASTRSMVLASFVDKTNVIIQYKPAELTNF